VRKFSKPDQVIEVDVGEEFFIDLGPTPLTGHEWTYVRTELPLICSFEQFDESDSEPDWLDISSPAIGRGSSYIFRCEVSSPFVGHLDFKKQRTWESEPVDVRRFHIRAE